MLHSVVDKLESAPETAPSHACESNSLYFFRARENPFLIPVPKDFKKVPNSKGRGRRSNSAITVNLTSSKKKPRACRAPRLTPNLPAAAPRSYATRGLV